MKKEIAIKEKQLPANIKDLQQFILVAEEAVKLYKTKLGVVNKLDMSKAIIDQTLQDGQRVGSVLLYALAKMGELLKGIPIKRDKQSSTQRTSLPSLPEGITHKQSYFAQQLAEHKDLIEETIKEAEENEDIPTKTEALRKIKEYEFKKKIEKQKQKIKELKAPEGLFDVIVIDPPWPYGTEHDSDSRRVASPYPEMSIEEIKQIKLPANKDCILWLWTTHKFIWEAKNLLEFWGFEYKSILVWDKEKMGIGEWLRLQCEFCLLGIKGSPLWENKSIRDIIREPRTIHSTKPEALYKMIEDNFIGKKLNYFGRKKRPGWEIYGTGLST